MERLTINGRQYCLDVSGTCEIWDGWHNYDRGVNCRFSQCEGSGTIIDIYKPIQKPFIFKTKVVCACYGVPPNIKQALFNLYRYFDKRDLLEIAVRPLDIVDLVGQDIIHSLEVDDKTLPIPMVEISPLNKEQLLKQGYIADYQGNIALPM